MLNARRAGLGRLYASLLPRNLLRSVGRGVGFRAVSKRGGSIFRSSRSRRERRRDRSRRRRLRVAVAALEVTLAAIVIVVLFAVLEMVVG